ncbi:MAG: YjbQ family protein [Candidatus Dadabacteria bacterium]|nr:MAG: YjbQ family protein [Candidatus Dadabacteria bacterium]
MIEQITVKTSGKGLVEITSDVERVISQSGITSGICTLFLHHTSASLIIQENADPSAKRDLEVWFDRLVKENDPIFTHTLEGADDMPAHIKSALTGVSLSIPIQNGSLALGTWQGIYLWEHRRGRSTRKVSICLAEC